jgi:phosphatidylglycerophosphate synthase
MCGAGLSFAVFRSTPWAAAAVVMSLVVNWFGDSLDGTLARVRHHERPRYGFYVDHVLDALGMLFLIAGLAAAQYMSLPIAAGVLVAYYLLMIEIALATHALGVFRISYWKLGPTELRILLAIGTLRLLSSDTVTIFGSQYLLFDVGGAVAIAALTLTFLVSAVGNGRALYRLEPLAADGNAGLGRGTAERIGSAGTSHRRDSGVSRENLSWG